MPQFSDVDAEWTFSLKKQVRELSSTRIAQTHWIRKDGLLRGDIELKEWNVQLNLRRRLLRFLGVELYRDSPRMGFLDPRGLVGK